jgi:chromosome segregation ATPase
MHETKFIQLCASTTALQTKITCYTGQINALALEINDYAKEFPNVISALRDSLQPLALAVPTLTKEHVDKLESITKVLAQHKKTLQKTQQKPVVQYQKAMDKCRREVIKIQQQLDLDLEGNFDFSTLRVKLGECQHGITSALQKLASCLLQYNTAMELVAKLEAEIQRINLPRELQYTAEQVALLSVSLTGLQLQLHETPRKCSEYSRNFLFLRGALQTLQQRSAAFTLETDAVLDLQTAAPSPAQYAAPAPAASAPAPTPSI